MGRGSSKAGGGSGGGKSGGNGGQDSFINEMVDAMTRQYSIDETPFSNSDLQSAVEAYAMTHKGVNEDAMLDAIRNKVETTEATNRRKAQIAEVERAWKTGKAKTADSVKKGDVIGGKTYTFNDDKLAPNVSEGRWSGTLYDGTKMTASADNSFKVTGVKKLKDSVEITADKLGGTPMTVKKKIKNGVYMRVYNLGGK